MNGKRVALWLVLCLTWSFPGPVGAQPFDLIIPDSTVGDSLSNELRRLQEIERDMLLEKMNRPGQKNEALVELAELRLSQGKLEEAERLFQMVIQSRPKDMRANRGLAAVYGQTGAFGKAKEIYDRLMELYPLSDALKADVERVRANLSTTGELGMRIHEDSRGITEIRTTVEAYFPSFTYPRLSARYKLEDWNFKDKNAETDSRIYSAKFQYAFTHRTQLAFTFAPEVLKGGEDIGGYCFEGVTGTNNFHLAGFTGRNAFKENVQTVRSGITEDFLSLMLFGDIHERARLTQSFTVADLSDENSRKIYDTKVLYFIHRRGIPFLSLQGKISQAGYERQKDARGNTYQYWTPSDFRSVFLSVGWERGVGSRWWWGLEGQYTANAYREPTAKTTYEQGLGLLVHVSYKFEKGRIYAEYTNALKDYYRERMFGAFASIDF
jgi:hypothetical protein